MVLPQAVKLKKTAPRFSAAKGPATGMIGSGDGIRLLAVGDSIIAGVGAQTIAQALVGRTAEYLARDLACSVKWEAVGKIGVTCGQIQKKLVPQLPRTPADIILVSSGVNDTISLSRTSEFKNSLSLLIQSLKAHSPQALIVMAGVPPLNAFPLLPQPLRAWFGLRSSILDTIARKEVRYLDPVVYVPLDVIPEPDKFSKDGFHPSQESYKEFAQIMTAAIVQHLKRKKQECD